MTQLMHVTSVSSRPVFATEHKCQLLEETLRVKKRFYIIMFKRLYVENPESQLINIGDMINTTFGMKLMLVLVGLPHLCFGNIAWSDDPAFSDLTVPSDFSLRASIEVSELSGKTVHQCAQSCVWNVNCSSFLYHPPTTQCTLLPSVFVRKGHMVARSGMQYWRLIDDCPIDKCFYRLRNAHGGLCLALYRTASPVTNPMSVDVCRDKGRNSSLAKIATRAQLDAVMELLRYNKDDFNSSCFPYVDARRKLDGVKHQFVWDDGSLLPMWNDSRPENLWSPGEPTSNQKEAEDCVLIRNEGWFDYPCEPIIRDYDFIKVVLCQRNL